VLPQYPQSAIRLQQTGVAVLMVYLAESRHVERVEVLEAPSPAIGAAARKAIFQWRFRPPSADPPELNTTGRRISGKVTFYFFKSAGQFEVAGPRDAPNMRLLTPN
jgi:TonB family protein